jgi:hypothetical protein
MQNLASVAAVLLHGDKAQATDAKIPATDIAAQGAASKKKSSQVSSHLNKNEDGVHHTVSEDALWGFGDSLREGRGKGGEREGGDRKPLKAQRGTVDRGCDRAGRYAGGLASIETLLEEVQRLRAENEILRAHHDQDKYAGKLRLY